MSKMVEAVAAAILHELNEGDAPDQMNRVARAAIEAMREPTEDMIDYGQGALDYTPISKCSHQVTKVWRKMVNAALRQD